MSKIKNDYFVFIEKQLEYCSLASDLLEAMLTPATRDKTYEYKEKIHEIEQQADDTLHDILTRLSSEFITPIDQEDILHLVQVIDDITDALDDVIMKFYMFGVNETPIYAPEFSRQINKCIKALQYAGSELKNFKKPDELRSRLIEINRIESEADALYIEAIHNLFANETDPKILIGYKEIYESLEACCDSCEHVSDIIEQIIIKNA